MTVGKGAALAEPDLDASASAPAARPATGSTAAPPPGPLVERRLRIGGVTSPDVAAVVGAASGSLGLVWLVYERILPVSGAFGFLLCWYLVFLCFYWAIARFHWDVRTVREKLAVVAFSTAGLLVVSVIVHQVAYVAWRGMEAFRHSNFLTQDMNRTGPLDPLVSGGVLHAVVGTLEQLGLATLFAVPLGIAAAIFMSEVGGRLARPVRTLVEAMTALPSIVAGLFILGFVVLTMGVGKTGFAASLALTVMGMPIIARASEVVIRLVPGTLREASYALGGSQWRTVWNVVLPTARPGLVTAIVLGMARVVGETAPVLLTAGFSSQLNADPLHGQQVSLPLYIWNYVKYPQPNEKARAFAAGLTLMAIVLILFVVARLIGGRTPGELSRRQQRRITRDRDLFIDRAAAHDGGPADPHPAAIPDPAAP